MADENITSTQNETTEPNTVVVPVPEPGQSITVTLVAEQVPKLNFDPGTESTQEFVGNDLVFTLDNGAVLTFKDFAADVNDGNVTYILLADGSIIPIDALLAAWDLEVPETAAAASEASGGSSQYIDDMGNTLGGVDKLGVQTPDPFGAASLQTPEDEQTPLPNDPPDATLNTGTIVNGKEDLSADGNLISNIEGGTPDSDPNNDPLIVTEISGDTTGSVNGEFGTLTWNPDGSYTYEVTDTDTVHALDAGETLTETFTYTLSDGDLTDSADIIVTIVGVGDVPTIEVSQSEPIIELLDASAQDLSDNGTVSFDDTDATSLVDVTFTSNADISWSGGAINPDLAAQLVAGFNTGIIDAASPGTTPWTYNVEGADLDFLAEGETITFSYTVSVTDNEGLTNNETVNFTLTGTNDVPVLTADTSGAVTEDVDVSEGILTDSGTLSFTDVDVNDTHSVSDSYNDDASWSGGTLNAAQIAAVSTGFFADGSDWNYTVSNAALQFLGEGETITMSYDVTVTDDSGASNNSDTETVSITITGTNDAPEINGEVFTGAVLELGDHLDVGTISDSDSFSFDDIDLADGHSVDFAPVGTTLGTLTTLAITDPATGAGNGTVNWTYSVNAADVAYLAEGETRIEEFTVTVTDSATGNPLADTATISVTITGTNDVPDVQSTNVWMSSDPSQQGAEYPDGYPLLIAVPTDIDGDNLTITVEEVPSGVYYADGTAVSIGDTLYDPSDGIDLLEGLLYRPTSTIDDTPVNDLVLNVSDGIADITQTVTISEVAPAKIPGPTGDLNSGNKPLTSGHDAEVSLTIEDPFAATLRSDPTIGNLIVKTNFQEWNHKGEIDPTGNYYTVNPGDQNGDFLEAQVNVYIYVDGIQFQAVVANDGNPNDWTYNAQSGLMEATIDFETVYRVSDPSESLSDYFTVNEPYAGDSWIVQYDDNTGGNDQARYVVFETEAFDPGNPGIIVNGDVINSDLAYGSSGTDLLTGNGGDDTLLGRDGNDLLNGGEGDDILVGGEGDDIFYFSANAGEGHDTISDFNIGEDVNGSGDILSFTDLLDVEPDGNFDAADILAFTDSVGVVNDGTDLTLRIPDQNDPAANAPTVITLAGVGADYSPDFSGTLTDLINEADINGNHINVDTYAS